MLYKRHPFSVLITTVASWHQPQQVMIIILTQCVKSTLFRIKKIKASFIYCVLAAPGERQIKSEFISEPLIYLMLQFADGDHVVYS